ncbi:uncharacterized protein RCC_01128 [Ramularia collo-cygni]|uniref:Phosphoglycerate mutase family protein n=1 Tax=Ramularia collo-cygni TaxID=112498 RepID=A0A2D3V4Q2_9PEZI|nr:uncharacterized protein RCC_01128 [Ramularia collo-cygni]CZT15263.1 uncharacterized protein RCC_01128 [Ramularia collo-cygni]
MAPNSRIILTRHAQAEHNVGYDWSIHDAPLTPLGRKQAASLVHQIPTSLQNEVELVVTSPLKRTLQTTKLGWAPTIERLGIKNVLCIPEAQECNNYPCDTGSSREVLEQDPEFADFDLSRLTPDWTSKQGFYADSRDDALPKRAHWVRRFLLERPEKVIVLVAHGDILRQITATARGEGNHGWLNAEAREYVFDPDTLDGDCFLRQEQDIAVAGGYAPTSTEADIVTGNL